MECDSRSLYGALTRARALELLMTPTAVLGDDARLVLAARLAEAIDVVGATATAMKIAQHRRLHPKGAVTFFLPRNAAVAGRYFELLEPLPDEVDVDGQREPAPANYALVPATQVTDSESAWLIGERVWDACRAARIGRRRAGYITEATMELADNALLHAGGASDAPVVCVSSFGRARIVEVSVSDSGTTISESEDSAAALRAIPGSGHQGGRGYLSVAMARAARAGVGLQVEAFAGTGRLLWRPTTHRTSRGRHVPGTTVVMRISA